MHDNEQVNRCIDRLCELGCDQVRSAITALESGQAPPQANALDAQQRQRVLHELKTIMAVYDRG